MYVMDIPGRYGDNIEHTHNNPWSDESKRIQVGIPELPA